VRIVRLANFVTDSSGGLRTALRELGTGYRAAGHEPVLVVPGATASDEWTPQGRVITLSGPVVPGTGGYRVIVNRFAVRRLLEDLAPDRIEVSDRTTLRWTGAWARRAGVGSMMVSHESLRGLTRLATGGSRLAGWTADRVADRLNRRTAADHDRIVCTTAWAAAEFEKLGATNLRRVPLGVDLEQFHPGRHDPALRAELARDDEILLVHCGRLSPEKRPERSLRAVAALRDRGVGATLLVIGTGPKRAAMRAAAARADLPVRFTDHVADRDRLAALLATADVVLAPGPVETFGLAALEALASGTPVVASAESALPEVVGNAGRAVAGPGPEYADAIVDLAARPEGQRRAAARRRAECFPWAAAVSGFLAAHGLAAPAGVDPASPPDGGAPDGRVRWRLMGR
jgi:alpha-1,6-mannosyltransferase